MCLKILSFNKPAFWIVEFVTRLRKMKDAPLKFRWLMMFLFLVIIFCSIFSYLDKSLYFDSQWVSKFRNIIHSWTIDFDLPWNIDQLILHLLHILIRSIAFIYNKFLIYISLTFIDGWFLFLTQNLWYFLDPSMVYSCSFFIVPSHHKRKKE